MSSTFPKWYIYIDSIESLHAICMRLSYASHKRQPLLAPSILKVLQSSGLQDIPRALTCSDSNRDKAAFSKSASPPFLAAVKTRSTAIACSMVCKTGTSHVFILSINVLPPTAIESDREDPFSFSFSSDFGFLLSSD